jgi:hypothetical protein
MPEETITANDYVTALGRVVVSSATMEGLLREAFCSLVGGRFAAIVAGGQAVAWLIDQCEALTDAHKELPGASREAIRCALRLCREANGLRNDLVHGLKAPSEVGLDTFRSRKNTDTFTVKTWTLSEIHAVSRGLAVAGFDLHAAIMTAFDSDVVDIAETLQ